MGNKLTDFLAESALALGKTVMLCVSALLMGILPGKKIYQKIENNFTWNIENNLQNKAKLSYSCEILDFLGFNDVIMTSF